MSIRQFSGRVFFNSKAIHLKVGGPVSDDGQQTVIAMDESTHTVRIIRCDLDTLSFQQLARMVYDQFEQTAIPVMPSPVNEARH